MQPNLLDGKNAKNTNKNACIKVANIKNTYHSDICARNTCA